MYIVQINVFRFRVDLTPLYLYFPMTILDTHVPTPSQAMDRPLSPLYSPFTSIMSIQKADTTLHVFRDDYLSSKLPLCYIFLQRSFVELVPFQIFSLNSIREAHPSPSSTFNDCFEYLPTFPSDRS